MDEKLKIHVNEEITLEMRRPDDFFSFYLLKKHNKLTLAGKVTKKSSALISLKMAERTKAKSAKRSFASKTV
jgi:hypothetical protein